MEKLAGLATLCTGGDEKAALLPGNRFCPGWANVFSGSQSLMTSVVRSALVSAKVMRTGVVAVLLDPPPLEALRLRKDGKGHVRLCLSDRVESSHWLDTAFAAVARMAEGITVATGARRDFLRLSYRKRPMVSKASLTLCE